MLRGHITRAFLFVTRAGVAHGIHLRSETDAAHDAPSSWYAAPLYWTCDISLQNVSFPISSADGHLIVYAVGNRFDCADDSGL